MFWNKKKVDTGDELETITSKHRKYDLVDIWEIERQRDMYKEQCDRKQKRIEEMQAVIDGNGEWYGRFQEKWKEDRQHLNDTRLHLKLEQEAYAKLYAKNRDLESELYILKREIEILKGEVK